MCRQLRASDGSLEMEFPHMVPLEKILVIRMSSLGDIVLTTPLLRTLRNGYPKAEIAFLTKREYRDLLLHNPDLDSILTWEDDHSRLREEKWDLFLDLQTNPKSLLLSLMLKSSRRISYRKRHLRRWLLTRSKWIPYHPVHTVDLYLRSIAPLGIPQFSERLPRLYLQGEERRQAREFLAQEGFSGGRLVGISPGARWEKKRWPQERFARIGDRLIKEKGTGVILFGNHREQPLIGRIAKIMETEPIQAAGRADLRLLIGLLEQCHLLITNDSGPMHLATGVGTPVVAIFGPTHPKLGFSPLGERDIILSTNQSCSPCSLHGEGMCWKSRRLCMERITVDDVWRASLQILDEQDGVN